MDYPGGTKVITRVLFRREVAGSGSEREGQTQGSERRKDTGFEDGGRSHQPGDAGGLRQQKKTGKGILPWSLQKEPALWTILDFWSPEQKGHTSVLFKAAKFVVIGYSSHRTQTQWSRAVWMEAAEARSWDVWIQACRDPPRAPQDTSTVLGTWNSQALNCSNGTLKTSWNN